MKGNFREIEGGVTAPLGFRASGIACGIKREGKDLAIIYSEVMAVASGMFTTNKFKSAPVLLDISRLRKRQARAIVINSGNANACTGDKGFKDALKMAELTAHFLNITSDEVLVASTGIIGVPLPMGEIERGIEEAVKCLNRKGGKDAARAITTTDTHPKEIAVKTGIPGRGRKEVVIGGMAKGAGMIAPHLATMLSFVTTDACISPPALKLALEEAVGDSFNMLTVDGQSSPNDTVIILASELARNPRIKPESPYFPRFKEALKYVCLYLAREIAKDGEGASKYIKIIVKGAWSKKDARRAARAIANSPLVKTAIYGGDPNWGRILSALGMTSAKFRPHQVDLFIGGVQVVGGGVGINYNEKRLKEILREKEVIITVDLNFGKEEATAFSSDLTEEYVKINAHYHT